MAYIFKCDRSTLQIKGKVNSITVGRQPEACVFAALSRLAETRLGHSLALSFPLLDNCKKFGLVFDHAVGIVEVINSKDIQIQVSSLYKPCCALAMAQRGPLIFLQGTEEETHSLCPPRKHQIPDLSKHDFIVASLGKPGLYSQLSLVGSWVSTSILYNKHCLTLLISRTATVLGTHSLVAQCRNS